MSIGFVVFVEGNDYGMFVANTFGNEIHVDYKSLTLKNV